MNVIPCSVMLVESVMLIILVFFSASSIVEFPIILRFFMLLILISLVPVYLPGSRYIIVSLSISFSIALNVCSVTVFVFPSISLLVSSSFSPVWGDDEISLISSVVCSSTMVIAVVLASLAHTLAMENRKTVMINMIMPFLQFILKCSMTF